jgi:putative tryptophan/tyrosine transport system substrate-binding protein
MRRRDFIVGLGSTVAWVGAARAQQPTMPVIGVLDTERPSATGPLKPLDLAFREGLFEAGYVEGANVDVAYRHAEAQYDRLPALAAELVRRGVAVILASGKPAAALAAKAVTTTIPIVFVSDSDPVELGLVGSLNRPGGNVTGVTFLTTGLTAKRLELLHETVPTVGSIGWLRNPILGEAQVREVETIARTLGVRLMIADASAPNEIDTASANLVGQGVGALMVGTDVLLNTGNDQPAALTVRRDLPTIYPLRRFVEAGGLMSYEASLSDAFHLAATYAARILKGEKPADLPVRQSTRFNLVVNRNAAKWLGIEVPASILSRADDVID